MGNFSDKSMKLDNVRKLIQMCSNLISISAAAGCSGVPIVITDSVEAGHWGTAGADLLIGIVSFGNFSALAQSGTGAVRINTIVDWIDSVISGKVTVSIGMYFGY